MWKPLFITSALLTIAAAAAAQSSNVYNQQQVSQRKCVALNIPMCADVAYNMTVFPNSLNHQTQQDAALAISQFNPLVKVQCSPDIKLFLCTVYAPVCTVLEKPILPCRQLCLSAKSGCESLMIKFGFRWPEQLECDLFPSSPEICVGENKTSSSAPSNSNSRALAADPHQLFECPNSMRSSLKSNFALQLAGGRLEDCSLPCAPDNAVPMLFESKKRRMLRFWTGGWAVACFISCIFTILTFLIDLGRFAYPVRPILYMAICYLAVSIVYMTGVVGEDRFACGAHGAGGSQLVTQGMENSGCSALAVAHYYFTLASSCWWVVLCTAWFLAARLKWGQESIDSLSTYFHFFCWGAPGLFVVVALLAEAVDGDVFTGVCSIGNLQPTSLFYFVFVPITACIVLGMILLACGIVSMLQIRRYIKLQTPDVDRNISKLEKLMMRICAFAVLYAVPTALSAAILCYQALQMPQWLEGWYSLRCQRSDRAAFGFSSARSLCPARPDTQPPDFMLFMMKYVAQLFVGVSCAVWVCSTKTVESYQRAYQSCFGRRTVSTLEH